MIAFYHRQITQIALGNFMNPDALEQIILANLHQDKLYFQFGHPHYHFDDNSFTLTNQYLTDLREIIYRGLSSPVNLTATWQAFGCLTHAAQDFYAHSNYVSLWLQDQPAPHVPSEAILPVEPTIMNSDKLRSGRIYHLHEAFGTLPFIGRFIIYTIPIDSHTWMNLDTPKRSPLFEFAKSAAIKRTILEYEIITHKIRHEIDPKAVSLFRGIEDPAKEV